MTRGETTSTFNPSCDDRWGFSWKCCPILSLVGVALIVGGIVLLVRRADVQEGFGPRVPIPAIVVRQVGLRQPPIFEVDYPGPDGRPLRGQVQVPLSAAGLGQALLTRGAPTTVWVDPTRPADPSLVQSGQSRSLPVFAGILLLFFGSGAILFALVSFFIVALTA
ncbi:MAG: hypothetical protein JWQ59_413 [Cryobacterium sp.]|nr:hypothetical protein [Cryobacterium sp.]